MVAGGRWLVAGGWWLVAGGRWLVAGGAAGDPVAWWPGGGRGSKKNFILDQKKTFPEFKKWIKKNFILDQN